jgi:preprotein translocase subunit Sec61beta
MAKKDRGEGMHSSAGLIRYFDSEEKTAIPINPKFVIIAIFIVIIMIMLFPKIFPY